MIWSPELQEQVDKKIEEQGHVKVSKEGWDLIKKFRTEMQKDAPNHQLRSWISFSVLLNSIEMGQIGIFEELK